MRIFLAAPFTSQRSPKTGLIQPPYRSWLERIIRFLEESGHEVVSAHRRENWGQALEAPAIALKNDIESLRDSEVIVVCLTNLPSAGVLMEIGMATALNKRMIIVAAEETEIPYLLRGLEHIRESKVVRYRNEEDLIKNLARAL